MEPLFKKLKELMIVCPDYMYEFVDHFALSQENKIIEMIISGKD